MRLASILLLLGLGAAPLPLTGQEGSPTPALGADGEVGWEVGVGLALSSASSKLLPLLNGSAAFRLSPRLSVGGVGSIPLRPVRVSPPESPERSELLFGYGGLLVRLGINAAPAGWMPVGSLLVGAGQARVRSTLVEGDLGADNVVVVEPGIAFSPPISFPGDGMLAPSLVLGYRFVGGIDPLPGVNRARLGGPVFALTITLVRDP